MSFQVPTDSNPFRPAVKEQEKLRLLVSGPSGSGKTWTALTIATEMAKLDGSKIAVIDTEGRSARKYARHFTFDVFDMAGDYNPAHYIKAIAAAERYGYGILVIDSASHAWFGAGGVLEIVDNAARKNYGNNNFSGWTQGRPAHNDLIQAILNARIHIIATARAKTEWSLEPDEKGKLKPVKLGVGTRQDSEFEYEFDIAFHQDMEHHLALTKNRCDRLNNDAPLDDLEWVTQTIHAWLTDGEAPSLPQTALKKRAVEFGDYAKQEYNLTGDIVLKALGVTRLSEWDWNRPTLEAEQRIKDYIATHNHLGKPAPDWVKPFVEHWSNQGFDESQMCEALVVQDIADWTAGREAADEAMRDWIIPDIPFPPSSTESQEEPDAEPAIAN